MHNSNSCSCILNQSSGLSLNGSIFLHFRNYGLAREFGLKIRASEAAAMFSFSPFQPLHFLFRYLNNTCICLSLSPAFIERCMHGRHCFWFKSHQVVLSILQTALLGDTRRNFVQGSNLWWNWPGSAVRVVFSPHLCLLLTYLIKEGNFFHRRHLIMSGWNCVCSIDSEKSLIWGNPAICCSGKKGCAWKKTRQNAKDRLKIRWER